MASVYEAFWKFSLVFQRYAWFISGYKFMRQTTEAVFQRYAWFNSGYKFMRQTREAGFPGFDSPRILFLPCLQAGDARHHGQYGPEGQFYARLSVAIPQVQLLDEVVVPVVCNDTCPGPAAHSGAAAVQRIISVVPVLVCSVPWRFFSCSFSLWSMPLFSAVVL